MDLKSYFFPFGVKPKQAEEGPRYADLYERGAAAGIDVGILYLLLGDLFRFISTQLYQHADRSVIEQGPKNASALATFEMLIAAGIPQLWILNALAQLLIMGLLIISCQMNWHTTPGKYLMGISIRRAGSLELPGIARYVLRFIAYIPSVPLFFLISFNKQHRGLHDRIAGTVVIHTRPKGWYWMQVKRGYRWLRAKLATPVE